VTGPLFCPRARLGALLLCAGTLPLLTGCTLYNRVFHHNGGKVFVGCNERPFAGNTDSRPPLKVPEGLSAPDTRNAVKIPELNTPERQRAKIEPCLAQPPNFFAQPLPLLQPTKGKAKAKPPAAPTPPAPAPATPTPAPEPTSPPPASPAPPASPSQPTLPSIPAPLPPPAPAPATPAPATPAPAPDATPSGQSSTSGDVAAPK
jgi:hypothetical protein